MKRIKACYKLAVVLFLILWFNITLGGGESSSQKSSTATGSYKTRKIAGSPLYSVKFQKPAKGDPVEMAYEFFELNRDYLHIMNPAEEFVLSKKVLDSTGNVVAFTQVYNGIPTDAGVKVYFTSDGEVRDFTGNYLYEINLPTTPSIDSASAVEKTLKDIGPIPESEVGTPSCPSKPIIVQSSELNFRDEDRLYLVWPVTVSLVTAASAKQDSIRFKDGSPAIKVLIEKGSYGYYIDALTGNILKKGKHSIQQ